MEGTRVGRQGFGLGNRRFWRLAVLAATGTVGVSSQAEAAIYYWQDSSPAANEPAPAPRKSAALRTKNGRPGDKKSAIAEKESKPQGPLIISIDTKGRNLIEENKAVFNEKKKPILERILTSPAAEDVWRIQKDLLAIGGEAARQARTVAGAFYSCLRSMQSKRASRNASRRYCSNTCASRSTVAAYRARRKA